MFGRGLVVLVQAARQQVRIFARVHAMIETPSKVDFPTTCWSRVVHAGDAADPGARDALESLCRDYWYPLYAFVRRRGASRDDAADLVQGFFADLIERRDLAIADPHRGRFRSFLRAACAHYLAHQRDRERATVRGGGRWSISIDVAAAEDRLGGELAHEQTAERLFERRWALDLLARVLARLEAEMAGSGKAALFARLRPMLEGNDHGDSYREVGLAVGLTEGAVKVAAHRLRGRYRELLRQEVARTVADPADVDGELAELIAAVAE
jgi:DNA-directed RNA polymerase specialized sigma24 family protein